MGPRGTSEPRWSTGHFNVFCLPHLPGVAGPVAGDFRFLSSVESGLLAAASRMACLSQIGLLLLQQRLIHHLTRLVVDLPALLEASAANLIELELTEDWLERAATHGPSPGAKGRVASETDAFDNFMSAGSEPPRELLKDPVQRNRARRLVRDEISRRFKETSGTADKEGRGEGDG